MSNIELDEAEQAVLGLLCTLGDLQESGCFAVSDSPEGPRYGLTPEGLRIARQLRDEAIASDLTVAIPRAVADEARELAEQRRDPPIPAPRQPLV
jgi:hypothetical protein